MSRDELLSQLITLAGNRFGEAAKQLDPHADFFDALGIDSMQAMELMTDLEEHLDVEIPDYELQGVTTFSQLAAVIEVRL